MPIIYTTDITDGYIRQAISHVFRTERLLIVYLIIAFTSNAVTIRNEYRSLVLSPAQCFCHQLEIHHDPEQDNAGTSNQHSSVILIITGLQQE